MSVKGKTIFHARLQKKKGVKHEQFSYRRDGKWFVVNSGPGYSRTSEVTEFDAEGLTWLEAKEDKEESR